MKKIIIPGLVIVLIGLLGSCEFDELKEPTNVSLDVALVGEKTIGEDLKSTSNSGKMNINGGNLIITEIEMEGKRADAEDYYFDHSFDEMLVGDLTHDKLNQNVNFNIPQGNYDRLKLRLHVNKTDTSEGLVLKGKYSGLSGGEKDVKLGFYNHPEAIDINVEPQQGKDQVMFRKNENTTIEIQLNLQQIFRYFNPGVLNSAEITDTDEGKKIIISEQHNTKIYYNLISRIEKSTRAVIK
ncbi:MAG: hypothetical protein R6U04_05500 [Bacteroidales bacterium]